MRKEYGDNYQNLFVGDVKFKVLGSYTHNKQPATAVSLRAVRTP